jgi:hypothetical protein
VLELEPKETRIVAFAWEPRGVRFALIHGEPPKYDVSIYTMETTRGGSKIRLLAKLERRAANSLYWSPAGGTVLLAGLKQLGGEMEWYNVNELQTMGADEHFMCTDVEWDPTGRYVTTGVSHFRHQTENGYYLWSSQGKCLGRYLKDKFYSLQWRPRPPSMLDDDQEREVRKNLRESSRYARPARARPSHTRARARACLCAVCIHACAFGSALRGSDVVIIISRATGRCAVAPAASTRLTHTALFARSLARSLARAFACCLVLVVVVAGSLSQAVRGGGSQDQVRVRDREAREAQGDEAALLRARRRSRRARRCAAAATSRTRRTASQ